MSASPYTPLDSTGSQIRLLSLLPATDIMDPIICKLDPEYLHLNPQYEALSYTWGSPGNGDNITLNNLPFWVWENAQAALRRLRYPDRTRRLWIDAICINQTDNEEKALQLLLMQKIYPQAERVCVWLGEASELSAIGMARLTISWAKTIQPVYQILEHGDIVLPDSERLTKMTVAERSGHQPELEWGEVRELLARPWWSRVWIVQEAVLAKSLVLLCGPDTAPWESVEKALNKQPREVQAIRMFGIKLDPNDSMLEDMFRTISHFREQRALNQWDTSIYELLYEFRRLNCTNPRDRIYGLLGLTTGMAGINIVPRYDKSISTTQVYTNFARTMIQFTGSLAILNCTREWRSVGPPLESQAFAYSVFNQASYHDLFARVVTDEESQEVAQYGWARLPEGWERVKEGNSCHYFDWNTHTTHTSSPLLFQPPPSALATKARRKCPKGWKRSHDNLGRVQIKYGSAIGKMAEGATGSEPPGSGMADLPSWTPNWAGKTDIDPAPLINWSKTKPQYRTSGSTRAELQHCHVPGGISLLGITFDEISELGDPWHPLPNMIPISRHGITSLEQWETLALNPPQHCPYGGPASRKEALWRTYIADFPGESTAPSIHSAFIECWYDRPGWTPAIPSPDELAAITSTWKLGMTLAQAENYSAWSTEMTKLMGKTKKTYNPFKIMKNAAKFAVHGEKEYGGYARRIHRACAHRRLLVTKRGYIGLAPWNAQVGDAIVVLYGGQTPFLLRRHQAQAMYKLVGEMFVYGVMGGEAMTAGAQTQGFCIV